MIAVLRHPLESARALRAELWQLRGVRIAWAVLVISLEMIAAVALAALIVYAAAHSSK